MKKVLAFGTSLSRNSINQQLIKYTASLAQNIDITVVTIRDFYPMEMYGMQEDMPDSAQKFHDLTKGYDGFIVSLAEHNGTYTAAFKNLLDWVSTIGNQDGVFHKKPVFIMGTAPGPKGAQFVIDAAKIRFPWNGSGDIFTYSLPKFQENFSLEEGIKHTEKKTELETTLKEFIKAL